MKKIFLIMALMSTWTAAFADGADGTSNLRPHTIPKLSNNASSPKREEDGLDILAAALQRHGEQIFRQFDLR